MPHTKPNPAREHRIEEDIVVDAYGEEERALSWYYYLEARLWRIGATGVRWVMYSSV